MRSKNTGVCEAAAVDSDICLSSRSCDERVERRDDDEGVVQFMPFHVQFGVQCTVQYLLHSVETTNPLLVGLLYLSL